jgi:hypothetical protein
MGDRPAGRDQPRARRRVAGRHGARRAQGLSWAAGSKRSLVICGDKTCRTVCSQSRSRCFCVPR